MDTEKAHQAGKHLQAKGERQPMRTESFAFSGGILTVSMVLAWYATAYFDETATAHEWSRLTKEFCWTMPIESVYVCLTVYFCMVAWHLAFRSNKSKELARFNSDVPGCTVGHALISWNYFLAGFSMLMLAGLTRGVINVVRDHGVMAYLCDGDLAWGIDAPFGLYMSLFMLSKFPELLDTVFLIIRGRELLFLHWYHHISVLMYCWLVTQTHYPGTPFAMINAFVHSIMYYYYARTAQGVKPEFARIVTQIQLLQMAAGLTINGAFMFLHYTQPAGTCTGGASIAKTGQIGYVFLATGAMYLSYFVLFGMFYLQRYLNHKNK